MDTTYWVLAGLFSYGIGMIIYAVVGLIKYTKEINELKEKGKGYYYEGYHIPKSIE